MHTRRRGFTHRHTLRGGLAGAAIVGDRERDHVGAARRVAVARVLHGRGVAVPEAPRPGNHRPIAVGRAVGETTDQARAGRAERGRGRLVRRSDGDGDRVRARQSGAVEAGSMLARSRPTTKPAKQSFTLPIELLLFPWVELGTRSPAIRLCALGIGPTCRRAHGQANSGDGLVA